MRDGDSRAGHNLPDVLSGVVGARGAAAEDDVAVRVPRCVDDGRQTLQQGPVGTRMRSDPHHGKKMAFRKSSNNKFQQGAHSTRENRESVRKVNPAAGGIIGASWSTLQRGGRSSACSGGEGSINNTQREEKEQGRELVNNPLTGQTKYAF